MRFIFKLLPSHSAFAALARGGWGSSIPYTIVQAIWGYMSDRRRLAVIYAKKYADLDEQMSWWAGFACALMLTHEFSLEEFQTAARMGDEAVKEAGKEEE